MLLQLAKHVDVDRHAVVLHSRRRSHVAPSQEGPRQVDAWRHGRQQALQSLDVAFAVVEYLRPLSVRPRSAGHDQRAHVRFLGRADRVEAEIRQRAQQAGPGGRREPIGPVPEFRVQVENSGGHWPAEGEVAAKLSTGVVGDEQRVGVDRIGRLWPELIGPEPECRAPTSGAWRPGKPDLAARPRSATNSKSTNTTSRNASNISAQTAQHFEHRVVEAVDQPVAEPHPKQFPKRKVRPFGIGDQLTGLEHVI